MTELVTMKYHIRYDYDITIEEAKEQIIEFGERLQYYADDVNRRRQWENAEEEELIELVNDADFKVIQQILKRNSAVFF